MKDLDWFKKELAPCLHGYALEYRFFSEGDFGTLNQVIFSSGAKEGQIDFWGLGWVGIYLFDIQNQKEIMNVLIKPEETERLEESFRKFKSLV